MTNYAPTSFSTQITARLRGLIAQYDINQADLATLCDVSQSQFSKIIRGVRPMTLDQLAALCDALDIDLRTLVSEVESYLSERDLHASPVRFVDEGDRLSAPLPWDTKRVNLDPWAKSANDRFWSTSSNVPGSKDDVALAASDDENWQERQEHENE